MQNERIVWPPARPPKPVENPDDKMMDEFVDFVMRQGFTVDQVKEAYFQLMGTTPSTDADPTVMTLRTEMERMDAAHFPVNRFVDFIGTLQKHGDSLDV